MSGTTVTKSNAQALSSITFRVRTTSSSTDTLTSPYITWAAATCQASSTTI